MVHKYLSPVMLFYFIFFLEFCSFGKILEIVGVQAATCQHAIGDSWAHVIITRRTQYRKSLALHSRPRSI